MAITQINSTSFVDIAAIDLGLQRLPGEDSCAFLERLYRAAASSRDHSYQGTLNELCFRLGLKLQPGLRISTIRPDSLIWIDGSGLHLVANDDQGQLLERVDIPLRWVEGDGLWRWYSLREVVDAANTENFTAELLIENAPAIQLARQSNLVTIVGESIRGARGWLAHSGVVVSSVRFNQPVPSYTLSPAGELIFANEVAVGLTICYQYRTLPYELVCSEVGLLGLQDAELAKGLIYQGKIIYQVREAVQELMLRDRSYWAQ